MVECSYTELCETCFKSDYSINIHQFIRTYVCRFPKSSSTLASLASWRAARYINGSALMRPGDPYEGRVEGRGWALKVDDDDGRMKGEGAKQEVQGDDGRRIEKSFKIEEE